MPYLGLAPTTGENNNFRILDDITSYTLTFDGSSSSVVSTSGNTITENDHRFVQGQRVTYNNGGGSNIGGLTSGTVYFIYKSDKNSVGLSTDSTDAAAGTLINLSSVGGGSSHTLNVAFDGTNTKFKATYNSGTHADFTRAAQLQLSVNGVIQQPFDTTSPSNGFGWEHPSVIIFSTAPESTDAFWGHLYANNNPTYDIADNKVDTFVGTGSTTDFTLSKNSINNENLLVTIDGVVQYPTIGGTTRAYTTVDNVIKFTAAPGSGVSIQVRHIGFAGANSDSGVTAFYGRTGNVTLTSSDNPVIGNLTAVNGTFSGTLGVTGDATFDGNVSIAKTLTYEDVTNIDSVGIITARDGIRVTSGKVGINETSPRHHLTVNSGTTNVAIAVSSTDAGSFISYQDNTTGDTGTNSEVYAGATGGSFVIHTDAQSIPRVTVTNGGKVGINTTVPAEKLSVSVAGNQRENFAKFEHIGQQNFFIQGQWGDKDIGGANGTLLYGSGTVALRAATSGNAHLVNLANGNIGIGELNPDKHLHISNSVDNGSAPATIRLTDIDTQVNASAAVGLIEFETSDSNDAGVNASIGAYYADNAGASNLQFHVGNAGSTGSALTLQPDKTASFSGGIYQTLVDTSTTWASRGNPIAFNNVETGVTVRNSSETDGCFTGFSGVAFNANSPARWQTASFLVKSVAGTGYAPEIHVTQRTDVHETTNALTIDTNQRVLLGHTSAINPDNYESSLQVIGTNTAAGISILRYGDNSAGPTLLFGKSRGANLGGFDKVDSGDSLGKIEFYGTDTGWESSASVRACADGEWYSGSAGSEDNTDAPGRLEFHTTPNASDNLQERLRIHADGQVTIGNDHTGAGSWDGDLVVANTNGARLTIGDTGSGEKLGIAANGDINLYSYLNDDNINFHTTTGDSTVRRLRIAGDGQFQIQAPNSGTHFAVGTGDNLATMTVTDTTEPSAVGVGGKIIFASKYYNASNTMAGAYIGQYKMAAPSNGVDEYRHSLTFGTRNENDGLVERLRITHRGRVGINTNNPDEFLEVYNATTSGNTVLKIHNDKTGDAAQLRLEGGRTSSNDFAQVLFANSGNSNAIIQSVGSADQGSLLFKTSDTGSGNVMSSYFQIAANGNIKLGKNSQNAPGALFHLEDSNTTAYDSAATTAAASLYLVNTGTNGPLGIILQNASTDGSNTCQATIHSVAEGTTKNTALTFGTRQNSDATIRERLRIDSSGNVLVGTTDTTIYNNTQSSGTGIMLRGGHAIDIARDSDLQLTLNRLTNEGANIALYQGGGLKATIGTKSGGIYFGTDGDTERLRITSTGQLVLSPNTTTTTAFDYAGVYFSSDNSTVAEGLFINNVAANTGDNASISFSTDSGNRKKSAISHVDTGNYGRGDLVFSIDPQADSGELDVVAHEKLRITSDGKIGLGTTVPSGRTGSMDLSSNDGSSGRTNTDQRHNSMLTLRNPSTDQHAYTQLAFINGGGTQAATLLRHFKGGSHSNSNYEGDLRLYRRTGGNGGANEDFRESIAWPGKNELSRQIWWASGTLDTTNTSRIGWHHLSAQQDAEANQYMYFRLEVGSASYSRQGMCKYTVVWSTGHASGYGYQIGHFAWYNHHTTTRCYVNDHIVQRLRYSNGSYGPYSWTNNPSMEIMNYTGSGGTNAGMVFRCEGNKSSGYDMAVRVALFLDLYVPESANGDTSPRLYSAGSSHDDLDGAVDRAYYSLQTTNPFHGSQPS